MVEVDDVGEPSSPCKLPVPQSDWQSALLQVKVLYHGRRYVHCTARCRELLDQAGSAPVSYSFFSSDLALRGVNRANKLLFYIASSPLYHPPLHLRWHLS